LEYLNLDNLESKISKVMDRMKTLRVENDELRKLNQAAENKIHELEKALEKTKQSLTVLESEKSKWMNGHKEKEERIRAKVSSLLEKLEGWEE
jgi:predicted  nucleic acid-binding Zn-ribbon protein